MMKKLTCILMLSVTSVSANTEITVDLPGGATMEMVWIEPGTFVMGTTEEQAQAYRSGPLGDEVLDGEFQEDQPAHSVTISQGFYLGKFEITQGQWEAVMGRTPWSGQDFVQSNPDHPAVYISYNVALILFSRLNEMEGEELYRLPTEAEWEYACRAGTTTLWSFGDDESQLEDYAWYGKNAWDIGLQYGQPVGSKLPNPWGLYDMHGNVFEWVQDGFGMYTNDPQIDPLTPKTDSNVRVFRGGYFRNAGRSTRSAFRAGGSPRGESGFVGVRVLRMGDAPTAVTPRGWGELKYGSRP